MRWTTLVLAMLTAASIVSAQSHQHQMPSTSIVALQQVRDVEKGAAALQAR